MEVKKIEMEVKEVESIQFGVYSNDEIVKMSACKIDNTKLSDGPGSVYDICMGTIDNAKLCGTCKLDAKNCPGHFGYIELQKPILHPLFYRSIQDLLGCFCIKCYRLLVSEDQLALYGLNRLRGKAKYSKVLEKIKKVDECIHCDSIQPEFKFVPAEQVIQMSYKSGGEKVSTIISTEEIQHIFESVLDSDVDLLGLNHKFMHPRNLVMRVFPVIPPCARPYVIADGNYCDDDITNQVIEIIKINKHLLNGVTEVKQQKLIQSLKFRVATLFNNSSGKAKHTTSGRPIKGIKERLTGKSGQIRDSLLGKRCEKTGRTVIGPDPTLRMGQLGVPLAIAENLTVPVMVSSFNIAELTMLLEKGRILHVIKKNGGAKINMKYALNRRSTPLKFGDIVHRGANSRLVYVNRNIELKEGDMIERDGAFLTDVVYPQKKHYNLQIGDVAERMLMDGDIVLLNRQPTLHSGSMMAQEVKVKTTNTFSFNLAITKSFNADFDGDEMNIHVPQTLEAQSELRMISASQNMIISPQTSKTNVTIVQDALLGAYQMTFGIQPLRRDQFFDISMRTQLTSDQVLKRMQRIRRVMHDHGKKAQCFHGKGVVSLILPPDFDYEKENKGDPAEPVLRIKGGVVVEGAFNKAILGSVSNGIIQVLNKEYGPEVATRFVDNIQFVANAYLLIRGFSIGIEDCLVQGKEQGDRIKDVIERCYIEAEGIRETTYHPGIREVRITAALSKAKDIGLRIAKDSLDKNNNFLRTVNSGSKGDYFNIAQITGLLGQQNLLGQRVAPELNNGSRSLPHYPMPHKKSSIDGKTVSQSRFEREMEYESRGFVASSFIKGLNPREFFFHAMSGREGICDTAMNTAKSGYIQRRIVKLTEDMKVCYDGTVRDTFGKVYQLAYGEDSMNPVHTLNVGGMQHCCDVGRLVNRLNATVEKSIAKVEKQVLVALPNTK